MIAYQIYCGDGSTVNRRLNTLIIAPALIFFAVLPMLVHASTMPESIRIGLTQFESSIKQITVTSFFGATVLSCNGKTTPIGNPLLFEAGTTGVTCKIDSSTISIDSPVKISPEDPSSVLVVSCPGRTARQYPGSIELSVKSGSIRLVNILPVDEYLKGVLPAEIGSSEPEEALKAQAIVARTFTLTNVKKHAALGYGLCDNSTCCQSYTGALSESERCNRAIADTAGQAIYYNDILAEVFYSTDCGGITQSYEEAYRRSAYPYLSTVPDPCELKHKSWEQTIKLPDLGAKLAKAGVKEADGIQSIKVTAQGPSGRAQSLEIVGRLGTASISGSKFRAALGLDVIKSTLFTLEAVEEGTIIVKGKGSGHGIGLCQTGAVQLAKAPHTYTCDKIIAHYFPGTRISSLNPADSGLVVSTLPGLKSVEEKLAIRSTKKAPVQSTPRELPPAAEEPTKIFQVRVKAPDSL